MGRGREGSGKVVILGVRAGLGLRPEAELPGVAAMEEDTVGLTLTLVFSIGALTGAIASSGAALLTILIGTFKVGFLFLLLMELLSSTGCAMLELSGAPSSQGARPLVP